MSTNVTACFFVAACFLFFFIQVFLVFLRKYLKKNVIPWWLKEKLRRSQSRLFLKIQIFPIISHRPQRNLNFFTMVLIFCRQISVFCFFLDFCNFFLNICFTMSPSQSVDVPACSLELGKVCDMPPNINKACTGLQSPAGNNYPGRLSGKGGHMVQALSGASFNSCDAF